MILYFDDKEVLKLVILGFVLKMFDDVKFGVKNFVKLSCCWFCGFEWEKYIESKIKCYIYNVKFINKVMLRLVIVKLV